MTESKQRMLDAENPYAATTLDASNETESISDAEAIRRLHIRHEASVKSVGTLYILACIGMAVTWLGVLAAAVGPGRPMPAIVSPLALSSGIYLMLTFVQGCVGYGLWQLRPWARRLGVLFGVLGLIAVPPIGTMISGYILYLLLSEKGRMVFSEPYRRIIAQTPHIKYKTSLLVWIVLIVFLAFMATAIIWALIAA